MKITVTKEDIAGWFPGRIMRSQHCPVANAIRRQLAGDAVSVFCGRDHASVWRKSKEYIKLKFPEEAQDIIGLFDRTDKMEPFEFEAIEEVVS